MNSCEPIKDNREWGKETEAPFQDSMAAAEDDKLVGSMKARLQNQTIWNSASNKQTVCTIHRVPPSVRNRYSEDYDPKIIAIGPYHREKEQLKPMEELKWSYLKETLNHGNDEGLLAKYISRVRQLEEQARKKYSEEVDELDSDSFTQMMVLDGCFIIQLMTKSYNGDESLHQLKAVNWNLPHLRNDLLLLENQIPFFILQSLFDLSGFLYDDQNNPRPGPDTLIKLASYFVNRDRANVRWRVTPVHLLHLLHNSLYQVYTTGYRYPIGLSMSTFNRPRAPRMIPNATKLKESGVKFKKRDPKNLLHIYFKDGVLEIPTLTIQEETYSLFRNLIAFEQCCPQSGSHFTSYAAFLNNLIDTPDDVAILKRCGIFESKLGKDEDVAELFNELCRGAYLDFESHYLVYLFTEVKEYSEVYLHKWRARLMHDYFRNPWTIISVVAAIFLLILTTVQTFYAIYTYHSPPH